MIWTPALPRLSPRLSPRLLRLVLPLVALAALAGCVVAPVGGEYGAYDGGPVYSAPEIGRAHV